MRAFRKYKSSPDLECLPLLTYLCDGTLKWRVAISEFEDFSGQKRLRARKYMTGILLSLFFAPGESRGLQVHLRLPGVKRSLCSTLKVRVSGFCSSLGLGPSLRGWPYFSLQWCVMIVAQKPRTQKEKDVTSSMVNRLTRATTKASLRQLVDGYMCEDKETTGPKPRPKANKT